MKILIIKPSSLGDVIHALPFLKALKDTFPDAMIDWVISKNLKGIIENNPLINEVIPFNKDEWTNIKKLPEILSDISSLRKTLQAKHYDMVVDLQGLLRSGLIALSAPTTLKIGFADAREGSRFFYDKKVSVNGTAHAVDKCLEVAKSIGARVIKAEFPLYINKSARDKIHKLMGTHEYVVIVPSARWHTKRWPAENFASLIKKISAPCVIAGSKADKKISQKIIKLSSVKNISPPTTPLKRRGGKVKNREFPQVIDLCGKTDLKELTALIAGARVVVTNDSGPMHIAAALDIPVIALFGPTDPAKTGPYGWQKNKKMRVIKANVPCSPCREKRCEDLKCMTDISVDAVFNTLENIYESA